MKKRVLSIKKCSSILLTLCLLVMCTATPAFAATPFNDVSSTAWYADAVDYVYCNGMMKGTGDTKFSPDGSMTRAMLATVLYRIDGESAASGSTPFTDVKSGTYYTDAVKWAYTNGIVSGTSATTFSPEEKISREQIVTMFYRYAKHKGYSVANTAGLLQYNDYSKVSSYAQDAFAWAVGMGIVTGTSSTTLSPKDNATRAQCATIIQRFMTYAPMGHVYAAWRDFLVSGNYVAYTSGYSESYMEYVMTDLNGDTVPELLIQSKKEAPFYCTWTFAMSQNEIVLVDEIYGYSSFRYSPTYNAVIVSPETRPFSGTAYYPFYILNGTQYAFAFAVGEDGGTCFYTDSNGKKTISAEERSAYFTNAVSFDWKSIQSLTSVEGSSKADLTQYLGTNINIFVQMIGNMKLQGSGPEVEYSNGSITVSAEWDSNAISFISINGACDYSVKGIEYGMSFNKAFEIACQSSSYISTDRSDYKRLVMNDGTTLAISGNGTTVTGISLFA